MTRFDMFIGRWVVFHNGHLEIIRKVYDKNKRPILILIMDTDEETPATTRENNIFEVLSVKNKIPCKTVIIPPISSVNWGRSVGYETNYIEVDDDIKEISGTDIRHKMSTGDGNWKDMIP